ncbi:DsrE family protein [Streptomyces peucetius]|uniref:DsrE family protein n=1 Tax=Streptomyces peucetius TaxID=1950 RepID=A0ABY6ID81_STRPE|nr:DsrE family protein [Streptomyces peucetius]UYQ64821.1 DsrE family protein [Streptomyces peucetius]
MTEIWESGGPPRLLLIESQGRVAQDTGFRRDAVTQVLTGSSVLLFLVQDGVLLAVPGSDEDLDRFQKGGGVLAADGFSLAQRGLDTDLLRPELRVVGMDEVAGWLLDPAVRVVWH